MLAQSVYTDGGIVSRLAKGQGAVIVNFHRYKVRKDRDLITNIDATENFEAFAQKVLVEKPLSNRAQLTYLAPGQKTKEKQFKRHNKAGFFILVGEPGEYTVTRALWRLANGSETSMRLFKKVQIEPGKIKYVGDLHVFDFKKILKTRLQIPKLLSTFEPQKFKKSFGQSYPLSADKVVLENIFNVDD